MQKEAITFISEEDLKNKIIFPYLLGLNFLPNEIELEKNFTIRLGKKSWSPNSKKDIHLLRGRLDILCKRNGMNLFIIEVKADNINISQDDIDQGISYARQLDYIAPFVLITNGRQTLVFDSITKCKLNGENICEQSNFWKSGCKIAVDDELNLRYEALKNFIGYSYENIKLFSHLQIEDRISTLKGSNTDLTKKYIPDLFVKKQNLYETFDQFLNSNFSTFAIIGESGVGKTNYICDLAENSASKYISFFYNALLLYKPIEEEVKNDFNWTFSSQYDSSEIFKRLESLVIQGKTKVLIFVDAIDESSYSQIDCNLNDFCRKLKHLANVKLCISCKTNEWDRFLYFRGTPTDLKNSLFPINITPGESQTTLNNIIPGYNIEYFSEKELDFLINKYKEVFKLKGDLKGSIREDCKIGFMLRIVAEVYMNKNLPTEVDDINLLNQYLEQKIRRMNHNDAANAKEFLKKIGQFIVEQENCGRTVVGKVFESDLKAKLDLSISDIIPTDLFSYNLLTRTELEFGRVLIGFYYTKLRDFIISIYSFRLPYLNKLEFSEAINKMMSGVSSQSALKWYAPIASKEQKEIMLASKKTIALLFLNDYERILNENFPEIKDKFLPFTLGKIGIVISNTNIPFIDTFGFRPIQNETEEIVISIDPYNEKNFFDQGAPQVTSFGSINSKQHPSIMAKNIVVRQLKNIINQGLLNEEKSTPVIIEKVLAISYYYREQLNISIPEFKKLDLPRYSKILPIKCSDLVNSIKLFYARYFYRNQQFNELIKSGKIPTFKKGTSKTYTYNDSIYNFEEIEQKAQEAIKNRVVIPAPNTKGDFPPFNILYKLVNNLLSISINNITTPLLPEPDIQSDQAFDRLTKMGRDTTLIPNTLFAQYSEEQLQRYIEAFFPLFIDSYNTIIETCFPKLKSSLPFYNSQPFYFLVEYITTDLSNLPLSFGYTQSNTSKNQFEVIMNPKQSALDEFEIVHYLSIDDLLTARHRYPISPGLNTSKADNCCILRSWVYEQLKDELDYLIRTFELQ